MRAKPAIGAGHFHAFIPLSAFDDLIINMTICSRMRLFLILAFPFKALNADIGI
jgi:hypothetical protein